MPDREKVLAALKACAREEVTVTCKKAGCPYWDEDECTGVMARDALELFEEQQKTIDLLYNLLNERCKEFRAKTEGDEVCGLCQYDGAYVGQSGDWCNECPGFETNECFEMKNEIRRMCGKELLPEQ